MPRKKQSGKRKNLQKILKKHGKGIRTHSRKERDYFQTESQEEYKEDSMEIVSIEDEMKQEIDDLLEKMSLEEKVAQSFVVLPESLTGVGRVTTAGEICRTKNRLL